MACRPCITYLSPVTVPNTWARAWAWAWLRSPISPLLQQLELADREIMLCDDGATLGELGITPGWWLELQSGGWAGGWVGGALWGCRGDRRRSMRQPAKMCCAAPPRIPAGLGATLL